MAESTIRKYRIRSKKPPSQTWRSFLKNHAKDIVVIDFFTVPTVNFRVLYYFIVLRPFCQGERGEITTSSNPMCLSHYVERLIVSIRRYCLDHVIVLNEAHLVRILSEYTDYYLNARPHQSLDHNSPSPRSIEPPKQGRIVAEPILDGLHHRYRRAA